VAARATSPVTRSSSVIGYVSASLAVDG
jgi:hypothetical protein